MKKFLVRMIKYDYKDRTFHNIINLIQIDIVTDCRFISRHIMLANEGSR